MVEFPRLHQTKIAQLGDIGRVNRAMMTLKHALSKAIEWKLLRKTAREELSAIRK